MHWDSGQSPTMFLGSTFGHSSIEHVSGMSGRPCRLSRDRPPFAAVQRRRCRLWADCSAGRRSTAVQSNYLTSRAERTGHRKVLLAASWISYAPKGWTYCMQWCNDTLCQTPPMVLAIYKPLFSTSFWDCLRSTADYIINKRDFAIGWLVSGLGKNNTLIKIKCGLKSVPTQSTWNTSIFENDCCVFSFLEGNP